jgi:hypothetical protein
MWTLFSDKMTVRLKDAGVDKLCNIPAGLTLADQILARQEAKIGKYLPGYVISKPRGPRYNSVAKLLMEYGVEDDAREVPPSDEMGKKGKRVESEEEDLSSEDSSSEE